MENTWLRRSVFLGGIIAVGFALWHFLVPSLHWTEYMVLLPDELVRAIQATNFFFSLSLSILGAFTLVVAGPMWTNHRLTRLWVWIMSGLWAVRVAFQVLYPQGRAVPGLAVIMGLVFTLTTLCFLIPALVLRAKTS